MGDIVGKEGYHLSGEEDGRVAVGARCGKFREFLDDALSGPIAGGSGSGVSCLCGRVGRYVPR